MVLPSTETYNVLGIFRIYVGLAWLIFGSTKIFGNFLSPSSELFTVLHGAAQLNGPYAALIRDIALPHAHVFGLLVEWGETLVGASLFLGLLTRWGAIGGVFLALNYWLAAGDYASLEGYNHLNAITMVVNILLAVLPAGLRYGLDGLLARRHAFAR